MKVSVDQMLPLELVKEIQTDFLCGNAPEVRIDKHGNGLYHLSFCYNVAKNILQDDCAVSVISGFKPAYSWIPHLTPQEGYIAQQHIFRTPSLVFVADGQTLILIPDIKVMEHQSVPTYLDLDAPAGRLTIGLSNSRVVNHILYQKAEGGQYEEGEAEIAFYLILKHEKLANPFRPILDFFWSRYGQKDYERLTAKNKNLQPYVQHTYKWAFENWKEVVWQEFEENGKQVGAPVFIVTTKQSPNYTGIKKERELRSIWNQAWFCSLRSASGLFRYAKRTSSRRLMEYALKTKELALSFPQQDGLFDSVVATEMEIFCVSGNEYQRSKGWETRYFGNSDRNPFGAIVREAPRHILDSSFTADYMLLWYQELEQDERLLHYAGRYAERLLKLQNDVGFFYGWVDANGKAMGVLDNSPESSMSAAFLLHYYAIVKDERFLIAALKAIDAVCNEIVPTGRWEDFETYWSCSAFWNDHVGEKIERNDMYKQCNFSMYFTALALLEAYFITGKQEYLTTGQVVLDEMLMTQSSYQPAAFEVPVVGGFGVLNADAELNDARQSLFSELILRYGEALSMTEYTQRGLAALRISFSMMYCPENPDAKKQWEKAWTFLNEKDYGFNMENYGHNGEINSDGMGIGEFTIYDWGNGAAAESYERMLAHFGEAFIWQ